MAGNDAAVRSCGIGSLRRGRLLALAAAAATLLASREASAWYFPEHEAIAHDALVVLPPELRAIAGTAVARARSDGLEVCGAVDARLETVSRRTPLKTNMIRTELSVDCVPYAVLSALAGDHASSTAELRTVLTTKKGIEIASAAAFEWARFREALDRLPNTTIERMSFVHELDVAFYFIDPGYELRAQATRAHFVDAGRPLEELARNAAIAGAIDNSLGQFLVHHVRSLESAARSDVTEAVLEHAFALHFLQDAFSAGHLALTAESWARRGNTGARRRHDFFDAKGLPVRRAMSVEPCGTLASSLELGLPACWTTSGDGYLGLSPDASDRSHAARAAAIAELELAMALDAPRFLSIAEAAPDREQLELGALLDPTPWWTLAARDRGKKTPSVARARRVIRGAVEAVGRLRDATPTPAVVVGSPAPSGLFDAGFVATAFEPCVARADEPVASDASAEPDPACGANQALALGTVGTSLLRPILAEWPASQVDVATLEGISKIDHGLAVELLAAGSAGALFPPRAPVDFFAPAVGVSAGLSYRWGTYLPGRQNRSLAELNVGISDWLHYDSSLHAGGNPHVTMLDQELRWPIAFEVITSYTLPLDLRRSHEAGTAVFLSGMRVHELLTNPTPVFWGMELEIAAIALSRGRGSYPLYASSPELRFYLGVADPAAAQPSLPHRWGPTLGITFTGGYATFL